METRRSGARFCRRRVWRPHAAGVVVLRRCLASPRTGNAVEAEFVPDQVHRHDRSREPDARQSLSRAQRRRYREQRIKFVWSNRKVARRAVRSRLRHEPPTRSVRHRMAKRQDGRLQPRRAQGSLHRRADVRLRIRPEKRDAAVSRPGIAVRVRRSDVLEQPRSELSGAPVHHFRNVGDRQHRKVQGGRQSVQPSRIQRRRVRCGQARFGRHDRQTRPDRQSGFPVFRASDARRSARPKSGELALLPNRARSRAVASVRCDQTHPVRTGLPATS